MIKTLLLGCGGLGLAAATWMVLLPDGKQTIARATSPTPPLVAAVSSDQQAPPRPIRVVYPGPDTSDARLKLAERVVPGVPVPAPVAPSLASSTLVAQSAPIDPIKPDTPAPVLPTAASPEIPIPPATAGQTININSASIEDMNHLAGAGRIGVAIARHRPYRSVEDLLSKRVVRKSVYEKIRMQLAAE